MLGEIWINSYGLTLAIGIFIGGESWFMGNETCVTTP